MAGKISKQVTWTEYGPTKEEELIGNLSGAAEAYVYDCRLFARLAREAKLDKLPAKLKLNWEQFCETKLRQPYDVVDAIISGVEIIGEELPVPAKVAERVGRLAKQGRPKRYLKDNKEKPDNVRFNYGNCREYTLKRLERDAEDNPQAAGLAKLVSTHKLSANAAAIKMGWRTKPSVLGQLQKLWAKATVHEKQQFKLWIELNPKEWNPK